MRVDSEQVEALGRGGRPTLAELLDHLVFSPVDAQISLAGARMVMQRASVGAHLRDLLMQRYGPHEAMVTLMRIGYRAGLEDAQFVRTAWPNINVGDAFTAGTRLHMLSGVVKVETLSNDFDFERGRYASEFLWHGSVEAVEHQRLHGRAQSPVCWLQTGYAAGYASHFFRRLVVYKEIRCAAMGHKTCHLSGGTAAHWGDDDPVVRLFRDEIVPAVGNSFGQYSENPPPRRKPEPDPAGRLSALLAQPVAATLDRIAANDLPALISGPEGSGRLAVAWHLLDRLRAGRRPAPEGGAVRHVACMAPQTLADALYKPEGLGPTQLWLLESVDLLTPDLQRRLAAALTPPKGKRRSMIVATAGGRPEDLVQSGRMRADLAFGLGVLPVELPSLSARPDRFAIAQALLAQVATERALPCPVLTEDHRQALLAHPLPGQLPQLRALMTAALLDPVSLEQLVRSAPAQGNGTGLDHVISRALAAGPVDLDALSLQACRRALALQGGNVAAAARSLGLTRPQLAYRLRRANG